MITYNETLAGSLVEMRNEGLKDKDTCKKGDEDSSKQEYYG